MANHQDKTMDLNEQESSEQPSDPITAVEEEQAPAPHEAETATAALAVEVAELQRRLTEAETKAQENWDHFLRARAEMDNVRRRSERELENAHKFALERFAGELLGVKDSLEMGLTAASEHAADAAKLLEGTELTLKMLNAAFTKFGIVELDPKGERFDPARHEAMATQPAAEAAPNTVLQVVQKGYLLNDRLLRPAMVIVARSEQG